MDVLPCWSQLSNRPLSNHPLSSKRSRRASPVAKNSSRAGIVGLVLLFCVSMFHSPTRAFAPGPADDTHASTERIQGRILDAAGRPLPGISIRLHRELPKDISFEERLRLLTKLSKNSLDMFGSLEATGQTAANGSFDLDCPEGDYRLLATSPSGATISRRDLASGSANVVLRFPALSKRFVQVMGDSEPLTGVTSSVRLATSPETTDILEAVLTKLLEPVAELSTDASGRLNLETALSQDPKTTQARSITFEHPGYVPTTRDVSALSQDSQDPTLVRLARGQRISGRILSPSLEPVAGASIEIRNSKPESENRAVELESDADGRFAVDTLPSGSFQVLVFQPGFLPHRGQNIPAGTEDTTIRLSIGRTFRGRVVDSRTGDPVANATLSVRVQGEDQSTTTGSDGVFQLSGLPAATRRGRLGGGKELYVTAPGYGRTRHFDFAVATKSTVTEQLPKIEIDRSALITGRVLTPDGTPVVGASVSVQVEDSANLSGSTLVQRVRSASDGTFRADETPPNRSVILTIEHPDWPEYRVRAGTFEPAEERTGFDTRFPAPFRIVGRILDPNGFPIVGAVVGVRDFESLMPNRETLRSTSTDADGRYELKGLSPKRLEVVVTARGYSDYTQEVSGDKAGTDTVDASLTRSFALRGRVVDESGTPMAKINVTVIDTSDGLQTYRATTDTSGEFELRGLGADPVQVRVSRSLGSEQYKFEATPGQAKRAVFILK